MPFIHKSTILLSKGTGLALLLDKYSFLIRLQASLNVIKTIICLLLFSHSWNYM